VLTLGYVIKLILVHTPISHEAQVKLY